MENVIVFHGDEQWLKEKALSELKESILNNDPTNLDTFYGQNSSVRDIISCARTLPCFSQSRLIILKNPEDLSEEDNESLLNYIKNPTKTAVLAISTQDEAYFKKHIKPLGKLVNVKYFKHPDSSDLDTWIKQEAAKAGKDIKKEAVLVLKENIGNDLSLIKNELEKLFAYTGQDKTIEKQDVEALVGKSYTQTGFELVDAISKKDPARALVILDGMFKAQKKANEIIGLVGWYLRRLQKAKELIKQNAPSNVIGEKLRVPHWLVADFIKQVKSLREQEINDDLSLLLECDLDLKRSRYKEEQALELLVARLCG